MALINTDWYSLGYWPHWTEDGRMVTPRVSSDAHSPCKVTPAVAAEWLEAFLKRYGSTEGTEDALAWARGVR